MAADSPIVGPVPKSATELATKVFEEVVWLAPGLAPGLTLLAGSPKVGKSWYALQLAVSVADGSDVLYLALEDTERRLQKRLKILSDQPPSRLRYLAQGSQLPQIGHGFELWLGNHLNANPATRLVVIDVLAKIRAPVSSSATMYQQDYAAIGALKDIADKYNACILVIHHTRKLPDADPFNEISGSNGIAACADTAWVLKKGKGSKEASLYMRGRDVEEKTIELRWRPESFTFEEAQQNPIETLTGAALAIYKLLVLAPRTLGELVAALPDYPEGTVKSTVWRLVNRGILAHEGKTYRLAGTDATHETFATAETAATLATPALNGTRCPEPEVARFPELLLPQGDLG